MAKVILPTSLSGRAGGLGELSIDGATAGAVLERLEREFPDLKGWVLDDRGRLREHVNLFVNSKPAKLERPVENSDELFVIQAISGGSTDDESNGSGDCELLVGSKKGLIVLRGPRGGELEVAERAFPGQIVEYACRDPRSGRYYASATHGQFGPHLYYTDDPTGEWTQADGPRFPEEMEASVERIWVIEPAEEDGVLWVGVAPAALFRSDDGGQSWQLNRGLWDHPTRPEWEGGFGGLCLHSISTWPGEPDNLALGISSSGVWLSDDRGQSWRRGVAGLVPGYLPEEARADTLMHCIHKIERSPVEPRTIYMQFHGGVYRSDDAGESWNDIGVSNGLPAEFGFPLVADPRDPDRAFVIPLVADVDRVPPDGKLRVFETRDRGASWHALTNGLPQEGAYVTILRQAFCHDGKSPLGLFFGTESGQVFASADDGQSWQLAAANLPQVTSVRSSG